MLKSFYFLAIKGFLFIKFINEKNNARKRLKVLGKTKK